MGEAEIEFDPDNPYPYLVPEPSYLSAQKHSALVDDWLGLPIERIERQLRAVEGQQLWVGLAPERLLTPYTEIRTLLELIRPSPGTRIVDLGAGYGRMGFVVGRHFPGTQFLGIEYVSERVREGQKALERAGARSAQMIRGDLSIENFKMPEAEIYFIYDFGTRQAIDTCLEKLRQVAQQRKITVIGRGRSSRDAIERRAPWLSQIVSPEHYAHFSIYRT